jgi:hypothetical protein
MSISATCPPPRDGAATPVLRPRLALRRTYAMLAPHRIAQSHKLMLFTDLPSHHACFQDRPPPPPIARTVRNCEQFSMIRSDRQCSPTENKRANWPAIRSHRPIPARDPECAAKASTSTIPIVFWATSDPVGIGLVPSLNRPGGNVTGMSLFNPVLSAKRLELLRQMVPRAAVIAYLLNPGTPSAEIESREALAAASALGIQLHILHASSEQDLDAAFATVTRLRAGAR